MGFSSRCIVTALGLLMGLPGCSTDLYRTQTDALQIHTQIPEFCTA